LLAYYNIWVAHIKENNERDVVMLLNNMVLEAKKVLQNAYAPYSKFKVGACLLDEHGNLYTGCNVENASYGATICAESAAIVKLVSSGSKKVIEAVIIVDAEQICPPCGMCLQRLSEFSDKNLKIYLTTFSGELEKKILLSDLLPFAFSSKNMETFP